MAVYDLKSKDTPFTCSRCGGDANKQDYELEWPHEDAPCEKVWYNVPIRMRDGKPHCLRCVEIVDMVSQAEIHHEAVCELRQRRDDLSYAEALALVTSTIVPPCGGGE